MTPKSAQKQPIPVNDYLLWQEIYRSLIQIAKAIKKYKLDVPDDEVKTTP